MLLKELVQSDYNMKIVSDLGMKDIVSKSGKARRDRRVIFLCSYCSDKFETSEYKARNRGVSRCKKCANIVHGDNKSIHGNVTRLHMCWTNMKTRCNNVQEKDKLYYRNISYSDEFKEYSSFKVWAMKNGYSDDLELDRIDNSIGYSSDNCRWATEKTQARNRRNTRFEDGCI